MKIAIVSRTVPTTTIIPELLYYYNKRKTHFFDYVENSLEIKYIILYRGFFCLEREKKVKNTSSSIFSGHFHPSTAEREKKREKKIIHITSFCFWKKERMETT